MKVYLYALDTMADWEVSYLAVELTTRRFMPEADFEYLITGASLNSVTTLGGFTLTPTVALAEALNDADLIILPGADTWDRPEHSQAIKEIMANRCSSTWLAAICGATVKLGLDGYLNTIEHRSNSLFQLKNQGKYRGEAFYQKNIEVAVAKEAHLITAGSSNALAFTAEIFQRMGLMTNETIKNWLAYFVDHDDEAIMKLLKNENNN